MVFRYFYPWSTPTVYETVTNKTSRQKKGWICKFHCVWQITWWHVRFFELYRLTCMNITQWYLQGLKRFEYRTPLKEEKSLSACIISPVFPTDNIVTPKPHYAVHPCFPREDPAQVKYLSSGYCELVDDELGRDTGGSTYVTDVEKREGQRNRVSSTLVDFLLPISTLDQPFSLRLRFARKRFTRKARSSQRENDARQTQIPDKAFPSLPSCSPVSRFHAAYTFHFSAIVTTIFPRVPMNPQRATASIALASTPSFWCISKQRHYSWYFQKIKSFVSSLSTAIWYQNILSELLCYGA